MSKLANITFTIPEPFFNIRSISLPHFSEKTRAAIASGKIVQPLPKAAFVRECVAHYEPVLPRPTEEQYTAITQALLKEVPCLKDKCTLYWVSIAWNIFR